MRPRAGLSGAPLPHRDGTRDVMPFLHARSTIVETGHLPSP
jgi:hypothetical protein